MCAADCVLDAECRRTGQDRAELVREILHAWAMERIHGLQFLLERLTAEGISAASTGKRGHQREREGS